MKKEEDKFTIFEVEQFSLMLDDFDAIFNEKNKELQMVLDDRTIDSFKTKNVNLLLFAVSSYHESIKRIKAKFLTFRKNADIEVLNKNKKLVDDFDKKLKKYLLKSRKFINRCNEYLIPDEKTNNLT